MSAVNTDTFISVNRAMPNRMSYKPACCPRRRSQPKHKGSTSAAGSRRRARMPADELLERISTSCVFGRNSMVPADSKTNVAAVCSAIEEYGVIRYSELIP